MTYFVTPPNFVQVVPAQSYLVSSSLMGDKSNNKSGKSNLNIAPEVESALRSLMISLPTLELSSDLSRELARESLKRNSISQTGATKPERLIRPKSIIPSPQQNLTPSPDQLVNVIADRQEYDAKAQIFTATGNVTVKYLNSELKADSVKLNLITKDTTAEGNVFLVRGDQRLKGTTLVYNYGSTKGSLINASGFINLNNLTSSQVTRLPSDLASKSSIINVFGEGNPNSKAISRIAFQADKLILDGDIWTAENLRVTNDPYSPPELELRTSKATLTKISPTQDRLDAESPSLVFDQGFTLPIPINSLVLDRFERSFPARVGFDRRDGGGFFYQQNFNAVTESNINFQVSPQLFLQRSFEGNLLDANILGVAAKLDAALPESQFFRGRATLSGLNLANIENQLRANLQYSRPVLENHILAAEYTYRDRIFNGSLGFQDVRNSLGATLFSPNYTLGDTEINFSYQVGGQYIGADRDRGDSQPIDVASLVRLQGATALSRSFALWRGEALPAERETGLKYQPEPITPSFDAFLGVAANYSFYSSGESQSFVSGTLGLVGVFGNFSKPFLDYTKINISYTQGLVGGRSPFLFDRIADPQIITFGILQQVYGAFRFGAEQSINPATGRIIDSNYSLQYDRRTYAIVIRYNPTREIGEVVFRISDFNFTGSDDNVTPVTGGVERK